MKTKTVFETADGRTFDDEATAVLHEEAVLRETPEVIAAGRSIEEIREAIEGRDDGLAEALELVGGKIARARRERGDLKRRPKPKATGETASEDPQAATP